MVLFIVYTKHVYSLQDRLKMAYIRNILPDRDIVSEFFIDA